MLTPRFAAEMCVRTEPPSTTALLSEVGHAFLDDPVLARLGPLIDGRRTVDELVREAGNDVFPPLVWHTVNTGLAEGYLRDAAEDGDTPAGDLAFWDLLCAPPAASRAAVRSTRVRVDVLGDAKLPGLAAALMQAGFGVAPTEAEADFTIVLSDDYRRSELAAINQRHLSDGGAWIIARPTGTALWIGPVLEPGSTACWSCLADRLANNREVARFIEQRAGRPLHELTRPLSHPAARALAEQLVVLEALRWRTRSSHLAGRLLEVDLVSGASRVHDVVRNPRCPNCGWVTGGQRPELGSRPKSQMLSPIQSLERLRKSVSPIAGAIRSTTATAEVGERLLHNHVATISFPMVREDVSVLTVNARGRCGGAGLTAEAAELLALGEAVERSSGVWRAREDVPAVVATRRQIGGEAIDLADCLLFSDAQYAVRETWNAQQNTPRELVPRRLDEGELIQWVKAWPLGGGAARLLPAAYCYYGHPEAQEGFCFTDSNGCAAGESLQSAALSGLLELVERDCVALWWYNRVERPRVDLSSFDAPQVREIQARYDELARDLVVIDITNDIGVPVFAASSARMDAQPEDIMLGFGAGLTAEVALSRALRELNQFHPLVGRRSIDGKAIYETADAHTVDWLRTARRVDHPHLGGAGPGGRTAAEFEDLSRPDLREELDACVASIRRVGADAYIVDQTRADAGAFACRIIAPGLRHFWRRLAPGRLYQVPVELGWLDAARGEDELNPIAIFF